MHYNYHITYHPGHKNRAVDALSQCEELTPMDHPEEEPQPLFLNAMGATANGNEADPERLELSPLFCQIAKVTEERIPSDEHIWELIQNKGNQQVPDNVIISDRIPYHQDQVYIPDIPSIKLHILCLYHDLPFARHLGQMGTYKLIKQAYWWENMTSYIHKYVKGCVTCAQNKHTTKRTHGT